jgi:hypothetical protein
VEVVGEAERLGDAIEGDEVEDRGTPTVVTDA